MDLADLFNQFSKLEEETQAWIIKIDEMYVEQRGLKAIFSCVVIEEGHPQSFYIRLSRHRPENRQTVRLDPATDPIKTKGVKRSIALMAEFILRCHKSLIVEKHNLDGFITIEQKA